MTPIDKCNELIKTSLCTFEKLTIQEAKKISLMVVNEVISEHEIIINTDQEMKAFYLKYWKNVKQAIEKL